MFSLLNQWIVHFIETLQLIYDFKDGGGSFGLISRHPDMLEESRREKYEKLGVKIPQIT